MSITVQQMYEHVKSQCKTLYSDTVRNLHPTGPNALKSTMTNEKN